MTELIPMPRAVVADSGEVRLTAYSQIYAGPETERVGHWLSAVLRQATGLPLREGWELDDTDGDGIGLRLDPGLRPEEYRLVSGSTGVLIEGGSAAGVFWGAQTLRQLLGPDAYRSAPIGRDRTWAVPHVTIEDAPDSAGAASCSTWPGTSCPRTVSCATSTCWPPTN